MALNKKPLRHYFLRPWDSSMGRGELCCPVDILLALSASMPAKLYQDLQYKTRTGKTETNYQKSFSYRKFRLLNVWLLRHVHLIFSCCGKEHVKIIFIPVIALSFPHFCPKLEQTLHIHQGQHS